MYSGYGYEDWLYDIIAELYKIFDEMRDIELVDNILKRNNLGFIYDRNYLERLNCYFREKYPEINALKKFEQKLQRIPLAELSPYDPLYWEMAALIFDKLCILISGFKEIKEIVDTTK